MFALSTQILATKTMTNKRRSNFNPIKATAVRWNPRGLTLQDCKNISSLFLESKYEANTLYQMDRGMRNMKPMVAAAIDRYLQEIPAIDEEMKEAQREATRRLADAGKSFLAEYIDSVDQAEPEPESELAHEEATA
jgi:hypothetical protein